MARWPLATASSGSPSVYPGVADAPVAIRADEDNMPLPQHEATALRPLTSVEDLDAALAHSWTQPVVFYKHSRTCGTSAHALEEIEQWLADGPTGAEVFIVDVHGNRAVARAITERLGVRHESPQVLIVRDGQVRWHGSHWRVTTRAVQDALAQAAAATTPRA
jgi:bacillithiol system protein YtxJ